MLSQVETFRSVLWPDVVATMWTVGAVWFAKCWSENCPQFAKTQTFATRESAHEHIRIVLGL